MLARILTIMLALPGICIWAESPWLPEAGKLGITTMFVHDTFQDYMRGSTRATLPDHYLQNTFYTMLEYGLSSTLTLDVDAGYTGTSYLKHGIMGTTDTTIGLRWNAYHGESTTITLRGAGVINGSYALSTTANFSPGDKANGVLGSVLTGTTLPKGFFLYTETGYLYRENPVPAAFFGNAGTGQSWKRFTWTAGYQTSRSINGLDILPPPKWKAINFPATKKIFGAMDTSFNYRMSKNTSVGFDYCKILHGRNVGLKNVMALSFGFTIPERGPHFH